MAARVKIKSYRKEFMAKLEAAKNEGLEATAELLLEKLQSTLGRPGTRQNASKPGEPPRKRTGKGQASCYAKHYTSEGRSIVALGERYLWVHEKGRDYTRKKEKRTRDGRVLPAGTRREQRPSLGPTFKRFKKNLGETFIKFTKKGLSKSKAAVGEAR